MGLHINAYDLELPEYIEGEVNLYGGKGKNAFGDVYVSDMELGMNWNSTGYSDYTIDESVFNAGDYNANNFLLTTLPITSQGVFIEGELYLHHRIDISDVSNIITSGLPTGVEFAIVMPNETNRLSSVDITSIDSISKPWNWVESWQGYSLTQADFDEIPVYNPSNALTYNPSSTILTESSDYELVINDDGKYQINFFDTPENIINSLLSDEIQVDFHITHEFSDNNYVINEGSNTYDVELHWIFPEPSYYEWQQFEYHPDLTDTTTFNASFSHIAEYASEADFKSTFTEEFQFYPNEYNFTEFTFTGFDDAYYEVTLNLTYGGDFQERFDDVEPFGMLIQTESGERYLDAQWMWNWHNISATEPIFTFNLPKLHFTPLGMLEDSEVLVTYYYRKESLSYFAQYDNILVGPAYDFIIKDSQGNKIFTVGNLSSIEGNNITFTENIKNYLDIGDNFTIQYDFKTIGGLLDTKHVFIEVQPYHMKFYNNYYPFSGASILSPLYYNLSANYQYQMALNYRLQEKSMISLEFEVEEVIPVAIGAVAHRYYAEFNLESNNIPMTYSDDTPMAVAYFINISGDQVYLEHQHINIDLQNNKLIFNITGENKDQGLDVFATIYVSFYADLHNKYQYYHSFTIDLANDQINLLNWTTTQSPEDTLMANYESSHFIYDVDPYESISKGKVQQVFAILNDTNSLIYYVTEELNDATNGWNSFDTLIMKMGFLNPDVLDYLNVSFYYNTTPSQDELIGWTEVSLDMFEDDSGTIYISLPVSSEWNNFKIENDARIMLTPVFNNATEFNGDFYGQGLPTTQTVEWDSESVINGMLNVDLLRKIFSNTSTIWVLNDIFEPLYEINHVDIDIRIEEYEIYDNRRNYEVEYNNISISEFYTNPSDDNIMCFKDGDILYLKYNATLLSSIGFTVDEMVLQRAPFIKNYDTGANDVPFAEISLLGVIDEADTYTIDNIYADREKLVAWEDALDLTPFESEFYDTYQQKVFNISFDDINSSFKVLDSEGIENCYITDVIITSNDPRYEIVVDSFFIFEFDYNATLYDSEIFDLYPNNHLEEFYYGDFTDIYSEVRVLDASEFLPLYSNDHDINETLYFDAFDSDGNWFYFNSHLFAQNTSSGVYDITFNPQYSEEYYYAYYGDYDTLDDLYEDYIPHVANFSYLYISWADANAWKEWKTIATPNVNISTMEVMFEWYDDTIEDYESISYNQTLGEFEARNIAIETIYPFDSPAPTDIFNLSQSYSGAQDLDIMMIKGYFFNESFIDFDPSKTNFKYDFKCLEITTPNGKNLHVFEKIVIYINFTSGAYSDYAQFRLLDDALTNNPEAPIWTKNDTLYVDYEYNDIDYFLLMEEYTVGSEDSMFEYFNYTRNDKFMIRNFDSSYSLEMGAQQEDFQNFTRKNDPKTVLEFLDFDEDGIHELVIQKDDITRDGIFNSFKYGFVNPAGEITFHTLIQSATESQITKDKRSEVRITDPYDVKVKAGPEGTATRTITTNSTIISKVYKETTVIQKDIDFDGYLDTEITFEEAFYTTNTITYTEETTQIRYSYSDGTLTGYSEGTLTEYRNSTYLIFDTSTAYMFRDFEYGELTSTRYYDDVFPNQLSEIYNMDNNVQTVIDDLDDDDPSNDIITQAPALDNILSFSHPEDGISAIYDRSIIINSPPVADNILAVEKEIVIPGTYNDASGIADYISEEQVTLNVIEVIPDEGIYYDNMEGYNPQKYQGEGFGYYYFDEDGDGHATTVFVVDANGEVKGIGFDYDGNSHFEPFKTLPVERHIIKSTPVASEGQMDLLLRFAGHSLVDYQDEDTHDGLFLEPTFRDSLFDIWKSQYTSSTTELITQIKSITSNQFIASLTPGKVIGDIAWQITAQVSAFVGGKVAGAALSLLLPGIGTALGFAIGYFLTYVLANTIHAHNQQKKLDNYLKAQTAHNPSFEGAKTLSAQWWNDEYFGGSMPNTLQGTPRGIYTEVKAETNKYSYEGQLILAPRGVEKTTNFGSSIKKLVLDYSQQTRTYMNYSDFNDPRLAPFLTITIQEEEYGYEQEQYVPVGIEIPRHPDMVYMSNSLMFLENAISDATFANNDYYDEETIMKNKDDEQGYYDRIIPYMTGIVPSLQFADSNAGSSLPEFYLDYPIFVSPDEYDDLKEEYHHVYKVHDGTSDSIQLIPEKFVADRTLMSDVVKLSAFYIDTLGIEQPIVDYYEFDPITGDRTFTFDPITGTLLFSPMQATLFRQYIATHKASHEKVEGYDGYIVFDVHIEKYRDISTTEDETLHSVIIPMVQARKIATTQSAHASVLDYLYQYTIAKQSQERLSEIAYTSFVTIISTLASTALSFGFSTIARKLIVKSTATGALTSTAARFGSKAAQQLASTATKEAAKQVLEPLARSASLMAVKIVLSVASEVMEELYVDPWIEAFVSKKVRDMGGNAWEQAFWSSFAESGRESFASSVVSVMKDVGSFKSQSQQQQALDSTAQDSMTTVEGLLLEKATSEAQRQEQLKEQRRDLIKTGASTLMMFAGALSGGFFGSIGSGIGNMLIASSVGFDLEQDIAELELRSKNKKVPISIDIHSKVSDARKSQIIEVMEQSTETSTLSEGQKGDYDWFAEAAREKREWLWEMGVNHQGAMIYNDPLPPGKFRMIDGFAYDSDTNLKSELNYRKADSEKYTDAAFIKDILTIIQELLLSDEKSLAQFYRGKLPAKFLTKKGFSHSRTDPKTISTNLLGELIGIDGTTIRNWLKVLNEPTFVFGGVGGSGDHDLMFRKIRVAARNNFNYERTNHIYFYLQQAISKYSEQFYKDLDFVASFLDIMDDYVKNPYTMQEISKKFNPGLKDEGKGYIGKIRETEKTYNSRLATGDTTYSTTDKFFKFLTQILLSEKNDFEFTNVKNIKEFNTRVTNLVFETISSEPLNLIRNTPAGKAQFEAFVDTLYAINKARLSLPDSQREQFITATNPRGLFTLTDLARAISSPNIKEESARKLIIGQLREGLPTLQLGRSIRLLQGSSQKARTASKAAIRSIKKYVREESINALKGGEDWGAIGKLAHDVLEWISHQFLRKKGVDLEFEIRLKDRFSDVKGGFVADLLINAESFLKHVDNPLIREMIPKGIKYIVIDFSLSKNEGFFMSKTKKSYQSGDRFLLMVHYGELKNTMVPNIETKIINEGAKGKINNHENIGILTDDAFKDFLGINNDFLSTYTEFQNVMTKIYNNRRRSDLVDLIKIWDKSQAYFSFLGNKP